MFDAYLKWIEAHERLLLVAVAGVVLWFGISKLDTLIANHDHAALQQAQVVAQVQQEKNDALAKQVAQDRADYQALSAQVQARDAQLVQLQAQLVATLAQRQKTDASLPPTELVNRWSTLVPQAKPVVTPTGVTLDNSGTVATVQELEKAPVLSQQLSIANEKLENADKLVTAEGQQITTLGTLVEGLQTKATDDAKVCVAQIAVVRAEARKSKRRWFLVGFVAGFVSRQVIKVYTGL